MARGDNVLGLAMNFNFPRSFVAVENPDPLKLQQAFWLVEVVH